MKWFTACMIAAIAFGLAAVAPSAMASPHASVAPHRNCNLNVTWSENGGSFGVHDNTNPCDANWRARGTCLESPTGQHAYFYGVTYTEEGPTSTASCRITRGNRSALLIGGAAQYGSPLRTYPLWGTQMRGRPFTIILWR